MNYDGSIRIDTKLDTSKASKGLNGLASSVKKLGALIASAFAVSTLIQFGKSAINLASDLEEVQNVVDVAFGDMSDKANAFAQTALQSFGLSELSAKQYSSTFMAMAKSMGLSAEDATNMALNLTGLVGDVASFFNISQDLAATKLRGVFTGETEALKDLGVVMTQANLQAYAYEKGITKDITAMSQAEQVALRYSFVMDSLSLAQGDFARTSDSWANQVRTLSETIKSIGGILGEFLIKYLTPVVTKLNEMAQGLLNIAQAARDMYLGTEEVENMGTAAEEAAEGQEEVAEAVEKTGDAIEGNLAGFDDLTIMDGSVAESGETAEDFDIPEAEIPEVGEGEEYSPKSLKEILAGIAEQASEIFDSLLAKAIEIAPAVISKIGEISESILEKFIENAPKITAAVTNIASQAIKSLTKNLPVIVETGVKMVTSLVEGILSSESIDALSNATLSIIESLVDFVVENLPLITDAAISIIITLVEGITDMLPMLVDAAVDIIIALAEGIADMLPTIVDAAISIIITLVEALTEPETLQRIIDAGVKCVMALIEGLIEAIPKLIAAIPQLVSAIVDTIMSTNWLQVGIDIIKGIGKGLIEGVKSIGSAIGDACTGIFNGIKNFFGIHSPSTLMQDEVGKYIAEGIGVGFEDDIGAVTEDMKDKLASEVNGKWATIVTELEGVSLPQIGYGDMIPVHVTHEWVSGQGESVLGDIRDKLTDINEEVAGIREQSESNQQQSGSVNTRQTVTVNVTRTNRKAGKTIYPVATT